MCRLHKFLMGDYIMQNMILLSLPWLDSLDIGSRIEEFQLK